MAGLTDIFLDIETDWGGSITVIRIRSTTDGLRKIRRHVKSRGIVDV